MQKKAIYLIQEPGCLNPYSGAFQHITMGVKELSKFFNIKLFLNTNSIELKDFAKNINPAQNKKETIKKVSQRGYVYGSLMDFNILVKNLFKIPKLYFFFNNSKIKFCI